MARHDTFETLECYVLSRKLRRKIKLFCKTLPPDEKYKLADQIIRSSRSVTANIAEGYGRHHHGENKQFCRQARGSLTETLDHLNVALDDGYLTEEEYRKHRDLLELTWKVINGYIAYLERCSKNGVPNPEKPSNPTT